MKIARIQLQNFRGVREMDLEPNPRLTVLFGKNGAGKTTILDSLALPLSDVFRQPPLWRRKERSGVKNADIFHGQKSARISVHIQPVEDPATADFDLKMTRDAAAGVDEPARVELVKSARIEAMEQGLHEDSTTGGSLLAIRYVPQRHVGPESLKPLSHDLSTPKWAYTSALDSGKGCRQFLNWLKKRQHIELLKLKLPWHEALDMLRRDERPPGADSHLYAVRRAIGEFMGAKALHYEEDTFLVYRDGVRVSLWQLSDGERGLLGLVGDLTRRLSATHPHLTESDQLLTEAEAVVMIDEVELHLHPSWQRSVVPRLKETFPNVQFILTTHSPQALGEIGSDEVVWLEETSEGIRDRRLAREVYGLSSSEILEEFMETPERTPQVENELHRAYEAIERGDVQMAKGLLAGLKAKAKDVPQLEGLSMRIRRKEAIGQ